ncbi:MAG TPA: NAD(P)-dependent alcohol dehydrogenase [Candidatus Limnocylindria bacterium]|nr:NAD(P)-dependent alcohol dehydrogenase [Candidatus Limnocylindria bacterium]
MKAWVRDRYGPPAVLALAEVEPPALGAGDVRVRVAFSSVNQADLDYLYGKPPITRIAIGLRQPKSTRVGLDVAGVVEAVGPDVTTLKPGDEVFGDMTEFGHGAFAEMVTAPAHAFAAIPAGVSLEDAATTPQAGILAIQGLNAQGRIRPGQRVLINGASGSVGPFAVQIAKSMGAEVTGVASTAKLAFVRSLGADHVLDYTRDDFTRLGQRYDRILDMAAYHSIVDVRRALTPTGVYIAIGGPLMNVFGAMIVGLPMRLAGKQRAGLPLWKPFRAEDVTFLSKMLVDGTIKPAIDQRFPLSHVPDALRYVDDDQACGKVVIAIPS